ncbi:MAG: hypothetical protein HN712_02805 [Gemmatimonadetes bacterium]|jgi:hypothetical protein|nr:hypothetical protein [Gemmatimonadota bacterium]MBT6145518.1 hypothetical protein [Gemmatimonadota bacterium]MBT7859207.1 hypothetical protein [Gemmatimonadota bacterium]
MTKNQEVVADTPEEEDVIPTTRLALMLGAAIILLLSLLSYLAPTGTPVPRTEMTRLWEADQIAAVDVGETAIVCYLKDPQLVQEFDAGRPGYAQAIRVFRDEIDESQLETWRQAGLPVQFRTQTTDGALGPYTWMVVVAMLLAAGGWHLVDQARRHRRDGGPRQRIADLEQQLEQGKIDPDRYRREVEQLSTEL